MNQILFKIGNLSIYSYTFTLLFALIVSLILAIYFNKKEGIQLRKIFGFGIYAIGGGVIGTYISGAKEETMFYGSLIVAILSNIWYTKKEKLNIWQIYDTLIIPVPLVISIVKIWYFLNISRTPVILIEILGNIVIFILLIMKQHKLQIKDRRGQQLSSYYSTVLYKYKKKFHGEIVCIFLYSYGILTLLIKIFNYKDIKIVNTLTTIIIIVTAIVITILLKDKHLYQRKEMEAIQIASDNISIFDKILSFLIIISIITAVTISIVNKKLLGIVFNR